jgi:hypothetical protein
VQPGPLLREQRLREGDHLLTLRGREIFEQFENLAPELGVAQCRVARPPGGLLDLSQRRRRDARIRRFLLLRARRDARLG